MIDRHSLSSFGSEVYDRTSPNVDFLSRLVSRRDDSVPTGDVILLADLPNDGEPLNKLGIYSHYQIKRDPLTPLEIAAKVAEILGVGSDLPDPGPGDIGGYELEYDVRDVSPVGDTQKGEQ